MPDEVLPLDELVRRLRQVNARQVIQVKMQAKAAELARRRERIAKNRVRELEERLERYEPSDT